jgi:hypothetical protein
MKNKNLFIGILFGILIGTIGPVYGYYNSYTDICELNAGDLEDIVEDAIEDCYFQEDGGYPSC